MFGVTSLVAGPTIKAIGNRWALTLGALTYTIYTGLQILPVEQSENGYFKDGHTWIYIVVVLGAMINGWGASLCWNGQGMYITECAAESNKGLYNSILWMGNMATYISGNLMAAFVISDLSESLFYMIMTALCVITTIYFMFTPKP